MPKAKLDDLLKRQRKIKDPHLITTRSKNNKLLTEEKVRDLAMIQCTMTEIAACCRCSVDILERHFAEVIRDGYEQGKQSLRRAQYKKAMEGNPQMLIWCGKHTLKQREVIEVAQHKTDVKELLGYWKGQGQDKDAEITFSTIPEDDKV